MDTKVCNCELKKMMLESLDRAVENGAIEREKLDKLLNMDYGDVPADKNCSCCMVVLLAYMSYACKDVNVFFALAERRMREAMEED